MPKGDIVLVTFPFTDLSGTKLRPAVVLFESTSDFTSAFITSKLHWQEPTDVPVIPSANNGIKVRSVIRTSKIATLDSSLVKGVLGKLSEADLALVDAQLKILLDLE